MHAGVSFYKDKWFSRHGFVFFTFLYMDLCNIWVNKNGKYNKITLSNGERWIASEEFARKLPYQSKTAEKVEEFDVTSIINKTAVNPINGEEIPVLTGEFVKTDVNTGVVMSVPMHAPFDYYHYKKPGETTKLKEAKKVIDVSGRETLIEDAIKKFGSDENGLGEATKYVYKTEFNYGVLNDKNGVLSGKPAKDAKESAIEACGFRDNMGSFSSLGIPVFGVSVDNIESHKKFKQKYSIPFTLLSDSDKTLVSELGIKSLLGTASRVTFILNKDGKILKIYPKVSPDKHAEDILGFLRQQQQPGK